MIGFARFEDGSSVRGRRVLVYQFGLQRPQDEKGVRRRPGGRARWYGHPGPHLCRHKDIVSFLVLANHQHRPRRDPSPARGPSRSDLALRILPQPTRLERALSATGNLADASAVPRRARARRVHEVERVAARRNANDEQQLKRARYLGTAEGDGDPDDAACEVTRRRAGTRDRAGPRSRGQLQSAMREWGAARVRA